MIQIPHWRELVRRAPFLVAGLVLFGVGIGMMVQADLGLGPWDILHQGVARILGLSIGTVVIGIGVLLLALFPWLKETIGVGAIMNALIIGAVVDLYIELVDRPSPAGARWMLMLAGPAVIALGSGLYIGAGLGPGPRDGLMTGLARRGHEIWRVRTAIEVAVLVAGLILGGTVGPGTIWFVVAIGPMVQFFLRRLTWMPALATHTAP
ncbi:MAG TPA: hypothetical protein ENI86_11140 [Acidimicrobiales bacterium]|nr:hypothetical protein [Acidimicrobiales bacterium]